MKHFYKIPMVVFVGICTIGLIGCNMLDNDSGSPSSPAGDALQLAGYTQMSGGSTTVNIDGEDHQLNVAVGDWASFPYGNWLYVEINQQRGTGNDPGVDQVPVQLADVEFRFSDLPAGVTEVVVAVREPGSADDAPFTEIGRFPMVDGSVVISVDYWTLIHYFGPTHFSVWFQVLGGENEQGVTDITIEVSGTIGGQSVTINKEVQIGTNPPPAPVASVPAAPAPVDLTGYIAACAGLSSPGRPTDYGVRLPSSCDVAPGFGLFSAPERASLNAACTGGGGTYHETSAYQTECL